MKSKIKKIFKILKKSVKLRTLLFLILILVVNCFAWYIYISEVSSDITSHVRTWKIEFDNNVSQDISFEVEDIYPGMETEIKEIELANSGELDAIISCSVSEMRILNDEYIADGETITPQSLLDDIGNNYPFSVKFYIDGEEIKEKEMPAGYTSKITIEISWPIDSGDDETDTYWGNAAYDFMQENEDTPCLQIKAKVKASQKDKTQ